MQTDRRSKRKRRLIMESLESRRVLATFLLNELGVNPPDTTPDNPFEYVEIKGTPNASLDHHYLLAINGNSETDLGRITFAVNLSGKSVGANGLAVVKAAEGGHPLPAATTLIGDQRFSSVPNGVLPNSSYTFALVRSFTSIATDTDWDENNDGVLELPASVLWLDAVGWADSVFDSVYGVRLGQSTDIPDAVTRLRHSHLPLSASEWFSGDLTGETSAAKHYDESVVSSNFPEGAVLTPGDQNYEAVPSNSSPVARDELFTMDSGTILDLTETLGLLRNPGEIDADGDILGVVNVDASNLPELHGLTVLPDGRLFYAPHSEFTGEFSFTYQVTDGVALSSVATVRIAVEPENRPPVILGDEVSQLDWLENETAAIAINVVDPDEGDDVTFSLEGLDAARFELIGNSLRFISIPNFEAPTDSNADNVYEVTVRAEDAAGEFDTRTFTISVADANETPRLSLSSRATYRENALPRILAPMATLNDPDTADMSGGMLVVTIAGASIDDRLGVHSAGTGAGQVDVIGNVIRFEGVNFAEIEADQNGVGGNVLQIRFTPSANTAAVQALIRSLTFQSLGDNPATAARTILVQVLDRAETAGGLWSAAKSISVSVVAVNDRPIINIVGAWNYRENGPPIEAIAAATVSDPDDVHFGGGKLTVQIVSGHEAADQLSLLTLGGISLDNTRVLFNGIEIGTFTGGYTTGLPLVVSLNENSSIPAVTALLRAVGFHNTSDDPSTISRKLTFALSDGESDSPVRTRTIKVIAVNDRPVITASGQTTNYRRGAEPKVLLPISVVREDQSHFGGGKLVVTNLGAKAGDRVIIGGEFSIDTETNQIYFGSTRIHIGSVNANAGVGLTRVRIAFNSNATREIVQSLIASLQFRTVTSDASLIGQRTIAVQLTDCLGLAGNTAVKYVNVR